MSDAPNEVTQAESPDSDSAPDKPGSFWILWTAVGIFLIYPLSIGPVARHYQGRTAPAGFNMFYWPLAFLYSRSSSVHKAIDWYVHLWGVQ